MKIKSYTGIWSVEKVLYTINDLKLPFAITFTQIFWFVSILFILIAFGHFPPFSLIGNKLIKFAGIPLFTAWFMGRKTFDGKKPYSFILSVFAYVLRPKLTYAYKEVRLKKMIDKDGITIVKGEIYEVPNQIY